MVLSFPSFLSLLSFIASTLVVRVVSAPSKIYGVNLGSWLVIEPWMMPQEWQDMGGQNCACQGCDIASEWSLVQAFPDQADQKLQTHWQTWFSQSDVDMIKEYGLNTVRIPLGFWIVEPLVDRSKEFFAKGGLKELKRGLGQLKAAGISAILGHHGLPGAQTPMNAFTGQCTNDVQFYTNENYHRALIWSAVMTAITHLDPDFGSVFAIEAANEPLTDPSQTPGFATFQKNFVKVVRGVETALGINVDSKEAGLQPIVSSSTCWTASNVSSALLEVAQNFGNDSVAAALRDAAPMLSDVLDELGLSHLMVSEPAMTTVLLTNHMDYHWQGDPATNPALAAVGPQGYDDHLYYAFGGVANADPMSYLQSVCNMNRVSSGAEVGNNPLWTGEWSLATQFTADDDFLGKFADAQKMAYSKGRGWIFWNFKTEPSVAQTWSYFEGIQRGYFTKNPSQYLDSSVCDPYMS